MIFVITLITSLIIHDNYKIVITGPKMLKFGPKVGYNPEMTKINDFCNYTLIISLIIHDFLK